MTDSENPQEDLERVDASAATPSGSTGAPAPEGNGSAVPPVERPAADGGPQQGAANGARTNVRARLRNMLRSRSGTWAALAVLCVVAGTIASLLVAENVAHKDDARARHAFSLSVTSTGTASAVKLALQHEEDLLVSASTFFAANPRASAREFSAWARYAQALRRYPELQKLGFVALVRAPEATVVAPRTSLATGTLGLRSTQRELAARLAAAKRPPSYSCVDVAQLSRASNDGAAVAGGRCSLSHRLLSSRDTGTAIYTASAVARATGLSVVTPVYRGGAVPSSVGGRRSAFVGWLREVLDPALVLQQALRGHTEGAVRVRYRTPTANVAFTQGTPRPGAQSITTNLHNGWTVRTFGPAAGADLLADGRALVLMGAGVLLSVALGLLVFLLGTRREAPPVRPQATHKVPHEDLYDPLTGLPNRALMLDRAERLLSRAGRESGLLAGALFIDIDWFRDVSEKIGEEAGDQLLTIVAARLEGVVRAQDSVGRLDGDKFVVLVESAARGARLESLARRVIEALHKPVELDNFGPSFYVTASIGVAFGRYETADDLLRDARLAMISAKSAGKDRYTLFNANMRSVTESRAVLEVELSRALQERQFFLLYDPIYDLRTKTLAGVEAVIRWMRPTKGIVSPSEFMPLAEETGLTVPIGRWMLEEACARAAAWNVAGHRVGVSVKVSEAQLNRDGFATDVRRALQQSGIEPSLLTLEIAETTVMRDLAGAGERLREIKQLGVRAAIDDFGSAYAYHSDLQRLPLDFLKVDRSSLAASEDEAYRRWLLEAILIVGRDLSLDVIAGGVENFEQMTALQAMGCSLAQGPFMGQPTLADAMGRVFDAPFPTGSPSPADPTAGLALAAAPAPAHAVAAPVGAAAPSPSSPPAGADAGPGTAGPEQASPPSAGTDRFR